MKASMKSKRGVAGAVVLAGILAVGGFASTNTLVFEDTVTDVGFGEQTAEILTVKDIDYTLDATDKSSVTAVTLTVNPFTNPNTDAHIYIRPNSKTGTAWVPCTPDPNTTQGAGDTTIVCTLGVTGTPAPVPVKDFGQDDTIPAAPVASKIQVVIAE